MEHLLLSFFKVRIAESSRFILPKSMTSCFDESRRSMYDSSLRAIRTLDLPLFRFANVHNHTFSLLSILRSFLPYLLCFFYFFSSSSLRIFFSLSLFFPRRLLIKQTTRVSLFFCLLKKLWSHRLTLRDWRVLLLVAEEPDHDEDEDERDPTSDQTPLERVTHGRALAAVLGLDLGRVALHVPDPDGHALHAAAGRGHHLLLEGSSDGEVDVPRKKSVYFIIIRRVLKASLLPQGQQDPLWLA